MVDLYGKVHATLELWWRRILEFCCLFGVSHKFWIELIRFGSIFSFKKRISVIFEGERVLFQKKKKVKELAAKLLV